MGGAKRQATIHRRRRADRRRQVEPGRDPERIAAGADHPREPRGEPLPRALLQRPAQARDVGAALLPAPALRAAGGAGAGGSLSRGGVVSDYLFAKDRLFATLNLSDDEMALYDRIYQMLKPRTVTPDLVVYLQARTDVLLERIRKRGRSEERPIPRRVRRRGRPRLRRVLLRLQRGASAGGQRLGDRLRQRPRPPTRAARRHRKSPRRTSHWSRG